MVLVVVMSRAVVTNAAADAVVAGGVPDVFICPFLSVLLAFIILPCGLVLFPQFRGLAEVFMCGWIVGTDHES